MPSGFRLASTSGPSPVGVLWGRVEVLSQEEPRRSTARLLLCIRRRQMHRSSVALPIASLSPRVRPGLCERELLGGPDFVMRFLSGDLAAPGAS